MFNYGRSNACHGNLRYASARRSVGMQAGRFLFRMFLPISATVGPVELLVLLMVSPELGTFSSKLSDEATMGHRSVFRWLESVFLFSCSIALHEVD